MQTINVTSSVIAAVGYENAILEIRFISGEVWQYKNVPQHTFDKLLNAESKGKFFNREIKDHFPALHLRHTRQA